MSQSKLNVMKKKYIKRNEQRKKWTLTLIALSLVTMSITTILMRNDISAMSGIRVCGFEEEHEHTEECYTMIPEAITCGMEEHVHGEECFEEGWELVCSQNHNHGVECYKETSILVCDKQEHTHTDACKTPAHKELVCGKEAHVHSDSCYVKDDSIMDSITQLPVTLGLASAGEVVAEGDEYAVTLQYDKKEDARKLPNVVTREITEEDEEYAGLLEQAQAQLGAEVVYARFFEITPLKKNMEEGEPVGDTTVKLTLNDYQDISDDTNVSVLHFSTEEPTQIESEVKQSDDLTVTFTTDGFSVFGVVYTVDFHYGVNGKTFELSIPGGGFISFSKLVEALGISNPDSENDQDATVALDDVVVSDATREFVANVENVVFSSPELVWVGKVDEETTVGAVKESRGLEIQYSAELTQEQIAEINNTIIESGDWALISEQPFKSRETLNVTMKDGETFSILVTDKGADNPANTKMPRDQINVNNREEGITLKLFDYSGTVNYNGNKNIDAVWGSNTSSNDLRQGTGVNKGRTFVFSGSGLSGQEWYNNFTGTKPDNYDFYSGYRKANIVGPKLQNGYPVLSDNINRYGSDNGNLGYLFGAGGQDGVVEYSANGQGLQGLIRKDNEGYYYYSSEDNYARFDGTEFIDLYTDTYYKDKGQAAASNDGFGSIGFFPFTDYNPSKKEEKGPSTNGELYYNHQLGMSMQVDFIYPRDGRLNDGQGKDMIFEFSGDDDIWVYVDDTLTLDLGGVHQPIRGIINFHEKNVTVYEYDAYSAYNADGTTNYPKIEIPTVIPFSDLFGENGFDTSEYSSHTIKFFFLERGGCDSNCAFRFNLMSLATAKKTFYKVDGDNNYAPLAGATFTLYRDEACTEAITLNNVPMTATSDANGEVTFTGIPVRRDTNTNTPVIYYMKETVIPSGYLPNDTTYKLVYDEDNKLYNVFTLENVSSEVISNSKPQPIELSVKKQWQDAARNNINPENDYMASFVVQRKESHVAASATGETTVQVGYLKESDWTRSVVSNYSFKRGTNFTIHYKYIDSYNKKMQMNQPENTSNQYPEYGTREGTFTYTVPDSGTYEIYFYNENWGENVVDWTVTGDEIIVESNPTEFKDDEAFNVASAYTLNLTDGDTTGTFVGPQNGKFPVQEEIDGVSYTYQYYIKETSKSPDSETIYVDSDGKVISDISTVAIINDYTQTVINRQYLNIPFEKHWSFDDADGTTPDNYSWSATFQLQSRRIDVESGDAASSWEDIEGRQFTVSSADSEQLSLNGLPMYCSVDGKDYRLQYSEKEIAYTVTKDGTVVAQWQDPLYYESPVEQIGVKYSLHYVQDAGENGDSIDDYKLIANNNPENQKEIKHIDVSLQKTWPEGLDLSDAYANFVLKRYKYVEYRNFEKVVKENETIEWVDITLDTGNDDPQTLHVPKDWGMTIYGSIKANANATNISFSDGSSPSGVPAFSYDNSSENKEHIFYITFTADRTKTVTLEDGAQYVIGGNDGFMLSDINDPEDLDSEKDSEFEEPVKLNNGNNWQATLSNLTALEEDTQTDDPLALTRYVYRYYFEEKDCRPEGYVATFTDSTNPGQLMGDEGNKVYSNSKIKASNTLNPGSLSITVGVTVNHDTPSETRTPLVDGEYLFTVKGVEGTPTENEPERVVSITITNGQPNTVVIDNLTPGQYTVSEVTPTNGTELVTDNDLIATVVPGGSGDNIPDSAKVSFVDNLDTTNVTFAKDWKKEDKTTPLEGKEEELVTYTLMQIAVDADGKHVRNDVYEGTFYLNDVMRNATAEAPCIFYPSQKNPVTISDLPKSGKYGDEAVTYIYYAVEVELPGFVGDNMPPAVSSGTYKITNSVFPETSKTTDVVVEKEWIGENADQIGGVKFTLVQEKAELPADEAAFYPFVIHLRDQDGEIRQDDIVKYVKYKTNLNIAVSSSDGVDGSVWMGTTKINGDSFQVNTIIASRSIELRITSSSGNQKWGEDWNIGEITATKGAVSDSPKDFIDELVSTDLTYSDSGIEYIVNMPGKGSSEVIGYSHTTTDLSQWKTKVNGLPYYDLGEDGKYYTYRYKVKEVSIIDPDTLEEIEPVTQNDDGTGGESTHFTVEYGNDTEGSETSPLKITNTKKNEIEIVLKKVDQKNVNKTDLEPSDLLDGAKFKLEKYNSLDSSDLDMAWNSEHSAESKGEDGVFTFSKVSPGIYKIKETNSPEGYVTLTSPPIIQVNDDLSIQLLDDSGNPIDGNATDLIRIVDGSTTIIVGNTIGIALPFTGGPGTQLFTILGGVMIMIAGAMLVRRWRTE